MYRKSMTDAYGDEFEVKAYDAEVHLAWVDDDDDLVANLAFTPDGALKLARRLVKAAMVAYEQERDAEGCGY